jgi:hypothetical protein
MPEHFNINALIFCITKFLRRPPHSNPDSDPDPNPGFGSSADPDPDQDLGGGEGVGQPKMCIPPGKILGTPLLVGE